MVQSQDSRLDKLKKTLQKDGLVLLVHLSALFLFVRLVWLVVSGSFFIDPIRQSTTLTGKLAITFLLLSLTCTPIYIITGWSILLRARKPLGLNAFGYALLHGLTYVGWDYRFDFSLLLDNLKYERYIIVGGSAFLVLALLAITSHRTLKKRMGKKIPKHEDSCNQKEGKNMEVVSTSGLSGWRFSCCSCYVAA